MFWFVVVVGVGVGGSCRMCFVVVVGCLVLFAIVVAVVGVVVVVVVVVVFLFCCLPPPSFVLARLGSYGCAICRIRLPWLSCVALGCPEPHGSPRVAFGFSELLWVVMVVCGCDGWLFVGRGCLLVLLGFQGVSGPPLVARVCIALFRGCLPMSVLCRRRLCWVAFG